MLWPEPYFELPPAASPAPQSFLSITDSIRLVKDNTALQGDILVKFIVQRLLFL
jgi:hypothetical protein